MYRGRGERGGETVAEKMVYYNKDNNASDTVAIKEPVKQH